MRVVGALVRLTGRTPAGHPPRSSLSGSRKRRRSNRRRLSGIPRIQRRAQPKTTVPQTTTLLVVDPEEGDGEEVSRGAEWAKQVEAKLLEKSQQIADLMQENDDQKSLIQAQKKRIGEVSI